VQPATRGGKKTFPSSLGALRPEAAVVSTQLHWCIMYDFPFPPAHTIPSKKGKKSLQALHLLYASAYLFKWNVSSCSVPSPNQSIYIIAITISSIRNPSFASFDSEWVGWHIVAAVILGFVRSLNQVPTVRDQNLISECCGEYVYLSYQILITFRYTLVRLLPVPHSGLRAAGGAPIINSITTVCRTLLPWYPRILPFLIWIGWPSRQH
jgi:hypothetical protein